MAQQVYKVEMVDVDKLRAAPFNPADRTEARNLTDLKDSIQELGILQPIVATHDEEAPQDLLIEAVEENKPIRSYWDIG